MTSGPFPSTDKLSGEGLEVCSLLFRLIQAFTVESHSYTLPPCTHGAWVLGAPASKKQVLSPSCHTADSPSHVPNVESLQPKQGDGVPARPRAHHTSAFLP